VRDPVLVHPQPDQQAPDADVVREALSLVSGRWRPGVLLVLVTGTRRFSELVRALPGVSDKVLAQTLRGMEQDALIVRRTNPDMPARVEYRLTALGASLVEPLRALERWGASRHAAERRDRKRADAAA
jgi:DNA-binding HxlR family transcriptional regulator